MQRTRGGPAPTPRYIQAIFIVRSPILRAKSTSIESARLMRGRCPSELCQVTGAKRIIALAGLLVALAVAGATLPACGVNAQGTPTGACADACKAAYGACYKKTLNREPCMMQLHRCLQGCDAQKR